MPLPDGSVMASQGWLCGQNGPSRKPLLAAICYSAMHATPLGPNGNIALHNSQDKIGQEALFAELNRLFISLLRL